MNKAILTVDLGYGDAGKGTIVDSLVRQTGSNLVVRYNGGSQAAHNVVTADGLQHIFAQFGSGTLVPGVRTLLSKHMLVNPITMMVENTRLVGKGVTDALSRTFIDADAYVTTPFHRAVNKLREYTRERKEGRVHGSCGMGVGETRTDSHERPYEALKIRDFDNRRQLMAKLELTAGHMLLRVDEIDAPKDEFYDREIRCLWERPLSELAQAYRDFISQTTIVYKDRVGDLIRESVNPVFEGAQGIGLDETWGFQPFTTWSDTTTAPALGMLWDTQWAGKITQVGIMRTYATRHGPGPMVTYDSKLTDDLPDKHNVFGEWQKSFRCGWLDLPLLKYGIEVNGGLDCLAVTHVDTLDSRKVWNVCKNYIDMGLVWSLKKLDRPSYDKQEALGRRMLGSGPLLTRVDSEDVLKVIELALGRPVAIISRGPRSNYKEYTKLGLKEFKNDNQGTVHTGASSRSE